MYRLNVLQIVTFITTDGLVQLPKWQAPSKVLADSDYTVEVWVAGPKCLQSLQPMRHATNALQTFELRRHTPLPTWQEQGLCIGNTFWVTATNGLDICRRLKLMGYCRCTELLSDVVEHTVLSSGGEIVMREHRTSRQASSLFCNSQMDNIRLQHICNAFAIAPLFWRQSNLSFKCHNLLKIYSIACL